MERAPAGEEEGLPTSQLPKALALISEDGVVLVGHVCTNSPKECAADAPPTQWVIILSTSLPFIVKNTAHQFIHALGNIKN